MYLGVRRTYVVKSYVGTLKTQDKTRVAVGLERWGKL